MFDSARRIVSLIFRIAYPLIVLITIVITNVLRYHFIGSLYKNQFVIIYFVLAILYIISIYIYKINKSDHIIIAILPISYMFSLIPYEIFIFIAVIPKIIYTAKKEKRHLDLVFVYVILALIGLLGLVVKFAFNDLFDFGKSTILQSVYSPNNEYRADVQDWDQGALGGDTYIKLYDIRVGIFERFNKNIYHSGWMDIPSIEWTGPTVLKVNDSIFLDVTSCVMFENEKKDPDLNYNLLDIFEDKFGILVPHYSSKIIHYESSTGLNEFAAKVLIQAEDISNVREQVDSLFKERSIEGFRLEDFRGLHISDSYKWWDLNEDSIIVWYNAYTTDEVEGYIRSYHLFIFLTEDINGNYYLYTIY
jgi:hypothetical protein